MPSACAVERESRIYALTDGSKKKRSWDAAAKGREKEKRRTKKKEEEVLRSEAANVITMGTKSSGAAPLQGKEGPRSGRHWREKENANRIDKDQGPGSSKQ